MKKIKLIIAGSRTITQMKFLERALAKFKLTPDKIKEIVSGGAKGVDTLGEIWAHKRNKIVTYFPADWRAYKYAAGFIRNDEMAMYGDLLLSLWDGTSSGSAHMRMAMFKQNKRVFTYIIK